MAVFATVVSTRRSTRARPAATSSTARWRSSTRPWSETAKSTRSRRPPPRSVRWESRTRFTRTEARNARPIPSAPMPTPTIATRSASVAVTCTRRGYLAEREDDRVGRLVVREVRLARHRLHVDEHLLLLRELHLPEVRERHRLLLLRVDHRDRLRAHDRGALLDRQRHLDPDLLRVPGVLDRDRERQVGGRRHRVLRRRRERLAARQRLGADDAGAVQAGHLAAGRGGPAQPLQRAGQRRLAEEGAVGD